LGGGRNRASLPLADQGQEVGFKSCSIFGGMAQQDLDQAAFACSEMSLNPPARETMQKGDRLLSQELFEFFGRHTLLFMAALPVRHGAGL
jgi:hypothetical protein